MADQNPGSYTRRLKDKIKKNEKKINELQEQIKTLQEKLTDHGNCQAKINELEDEIKRLREENRRLTTKIGDLKESNKFLENEMKDLKVEHGEKLEAFEQSEDELVMRQLCSSVQENILKFVLQENFDEIENKSIKYIHEYIKRQIRDKQEKKNAKSRWENLRKEIKWDYFLIKQLKPLKKGGNEAAHPTLTEERIDEAKMNLKEKKKLSENMVQAVDRLKTMWKQTNSKLTHGSRETSAELEVSRDQRGPNNPPTYASKTPQ